MRKTIRSRMIVRLKDKMYPKKPWVNPHDLYGRKRHQVINALQSGRIGSIYGVGIYEAH